MAELSPMTNSESETSATRKLKTVFLLVRAVIRLKNNVAKAVDDFDDLMDSVNNSPVLSRLPSRKSLITHAIDSHKQTERLFDLIRKAGDQEITEIESLLIKNPTAYLRDLSDPDSFVNKPNFEGVRPITEAVRIGSQKLVITLIDWGASPHLESKVGAKDSETPLVTASRWNYPSIVKVLLQLGGWSTREIRKAASRTTNQHIAGLLKQYKPEAFAWWNCFLC